MKRILVAIPVLFNGDTCLKAFRSVINEADLLIIDNNSDESVKKAIETICVECHNTEHSVCVIKNEINQFVNPSWNTAIAYFLENEYSDELVIMNSDLILQKGWGEHLEDGVSCIPSDGTLESDVQAFNGTAGVFIHLNKTMAKMAYPIPESILIWFGDEYLYSLLRALGIKTIIKHKIVAQHFHGGSQTLAILPNKSEMIEADKVAWAEIVEPLMWERIKQLKENQ